VYPNRYVEDAFKFYGISLHLLNDQNAAVIAKNSLITLESIDALTRDDHYLFDYITDVPYFIEITKPLVQINPTLSGALELSSAKSHKPSLTVIIYFLLKIYLQQLIHQSLVS
jgi:hypothetical protein